MNSNLIQSNDLLKVKQSNIYSDAECTYITEDKFSSFILSDIVNDDGNADQ